MEKSSIQQVTELGTFLDDWAGLAEPLVIKAIILYKKVLSIQRR